MLLPLGGVYVSSKCTNTRLTGAFKTYQEDATAGVSLPFVNGVDNLRTVSIAKDGGGRCKWKLLSIQVRFRAANDNPLAKGEKVVDTTYDFDFIGYGADGGGFGTSRTKEVKGDLDIKTDFFPMITKFTDNDINLKFFGGDTANEKWGRRFSLNGTRHIAIAPVIHLNKVVTLLAPDNTDNWIAIYPDGSKEEIPYIFPDYDKLLSMK